MTPDLTASQLVESRRFREDFGLRRDEAWIRAVAADPASDRRTFGVPLTKGEVDELNARTSTIEAIKVQVHTYAEGHSDEWAGAYTDHDRGGVFVAQFSGHADIHRRALLQQVRPGSPLEVRQVRWSLLQLKEFSDQLRGDDPWFLTIPAYLVGYGPDVVANRVGVQISSADEAAPAKIRAHYGWATDVVEVTSDGTGALLLRSGVLRILATDRSGKPAVGLTCIAIPDLVGAYEPRQLPTPVTDTHGMCEVRLPATGYWIRLEMGEAPPRLVVIGRAVVVADETVEVAITTP